MKRSLLLIVSSLLINMAVVCAETINIAAVNNPDMVDLKKLSAKFVEKNPGVTLNWILLEENLLRQRVTVDVSTGSGQFDLVFIGLYETPLFA